MKETGMFVVLLKGANHRFESNVGYSGQNTKQVSDCFRSVKILPDSRIIHVRNVTIRLLYVFFVLFQNSNRKIRCYKFVIL